ncbi:hypothetical protein LTR28_004518 [Elasticomyces elasticus]|nr:hypothetical protein LTR28_004518 [Elasticomyces elasticus]
MASSRASHAFDSHPSLPSIEEFEARALSPVDYGSTHSGFRAQSEYTESEPGVDNGSWSPPAWRKAGSGWFRHQQSASASESRETSPRYESAMEDDVEDEDVTAAYPVPAMIPLPGSPEKERSPSPGPNPAFGGGGDGGGHARPGAQDAAPQGGQSHDDGRENYIRLSVRADVCQRTEPIEAVFLYFRKTFAPLLKSRTTTFLSVLVAFLSFTALRALTQPPQTGPTPDLVKVAGLAKSFEPLIYYSENGHAQIGELQETGVAVWDLGESVRSTNMTSAPIIVRELDELSESLKTLAIDLTRFFASVDGDVDSILIVMEWASRELHALTDTPPSHLSSAFSNLHNILSRVGFLENPSTGAPTAIGKLVSELFGQTSPQRTKATLQRTFTEFLGVLEESINNELTHSTALFSLFEAIDHQFLNLQRTVIRETDNQEQRASELLSSLWTSVLGANKSSLRKYEKNRVLLTNIRERTVYNKHVLVEHNQRLLQLKTNLEVLRKKLVSPLVRGAAEGGGSLTVEEQIRGLEGTYEQLRLGRERQKGRLLEVLYGSGNRRVGLVREEAAIDAPR